MSRAIPPTTSRVLITLVLYSAALSSAVGEFVGECSDNPVNVTESLWLQIQSNGVCEPYHGLAELCNPVFEKDVDYVYIPYTRTDGDQESLSSQVNFAIVIVNFVPERCREVARRLLCNFYLIPCGRNGTMFPPQAICTDECEYLSNDLCPDEWQNAVNHFNGDMKEHFESLGLSLVNCSNPGRILEPLPYCCKNYGLIPEPVNSTLPIRTIIIASAAGGGGFLIMVAIVVTACFCCLKQYHHAPDSNEMKSPTSTHAYTAPHFVIEDTDQRHTLEANDGVTLRHRSEAAFRVPSAYMRELSGRLLIMHEQLQLMDCVGQGEFAVVYRAQWSGFHGESSQLVAVKTLKAIFNQGDIEHLMEESLTMKKFDHPNVLNLIGVCVDGGPAPLLVVPFMANGSLLKYLKKERPKLTIAEEADSDLIEEAQRKLLPMCLQIARGMEYLAEQKFVHRDLAARNCMIDEHGLIKVADFGLSEDIYKRNYFRQGKEDNPVKLPFKWMALESLQDGVFTEKTDVWSFGVTCWEVFSAGRTPYPGVDPFSLIKFLEEGKRLDKPSNAACSDEIYSLMLYCWSQSVVERPEFSVIVQNISVILEDVAAYIDFNYMPKESVDGSSRYDELNFQQAKVHGIIEGNNKAERLMINRQGYDHLY